MILNEISLKTINASKTVIKDQISQFLDVCHELFQQKKREGILLYKRISERAISRGLFYT